MKRQIVARYLPGYLRFLLLLLAFPVVSDDLTVTGWIEDAFLLPDNFRLRAKIDTGARHSSLNATNLIVQKSNGMSKVRFDITNRYDEKITIEKPVHRIATIKRHTGASQKRPVIFLDICLGGVARHVEVNLIDRTEFKYQLLIGRSFLRGKFLVDPDKSDLLKSGCKS